MSLVSKSLALRIGTGLGVMSLGMVLLWTPILLPGYVIFVLLVMLVGLLEYHRMAAKLGFQ